MIPSARVPPEQTAEMHGLAPFLAHLFAPFSECVPTDTRERFELWAIGNRFRNRIVGGLLREIDASFAAAKTPAVLLKGAALLHSLYDEAGPRPLSDIDVPVVPRRAGRRGPRTAPRARKATRQGLRNEALKVFAGLGKLHSFCPMWAAGRPWHETCCFACHRHHQSKLAGH